ncbi:DUF1178 family protein [Paradevosia shaoguanensis]|uniref:DUF1178 family protein n=1 Tax=Paradevosia shaoguanensis TaxID=1335043 RepID=UPI0019333778|nr:DUF1178 family protein [Paradevosia shaoguanensis]
MIHYSLVCENEHKFEAWFANAGAFDAQSKRGIVTCPVCDSRQVHKALMAPAVSRTKSEKVSLSIGHPQHDQIRAALRAMRDKVTSEADYVGDKFAEEARKIHFKDVEARGIYGEATADEVAALVEDGVDFMPLPNIPEDHN